ncbi:FlgD immunoglobulin-like domain containing protein [Candidatus Neomarinimicrobiota bacterium]
MNRNLLIQMLAVIAIFSVSAAFGQWQVYSGNVLPYDDDTAWYESGGSVDPPDNIAELLVMVDDPDIAGNKLIKVGDMALFTWGYKETWKHYLGGNPNVGQTLVWRAKELDAIAFERGMDMYMHNGMVRERFITKTNGTQIQLDKSKAIANVDATVWHVYRWTALADQFNVYVDEDPIPWLTATGEPWPDDNYFQFGDNGGDPYGALYDWFIWDTTGAYAPGEGSGFPDSLTGVDQWLAVDEPGQSPQEFALGQNYPNPFNPSTVIDYQINAAVNVDLAVYDITGQLITTLVSGEQQPGAYSVIWNGRHSNGDMVASGVYFYAIQVGADKITKKMLLIK